MRSRPILFTLVLVALVMVAGSHAYAAPPSPATSTVDPCLSVCPGGDVNFHVAVRDASSNPVGASSVLINFSNCLGLTLCPPRVSDPYTIVPPSSIVMTANAAGIADFQIRAGGVCVGTVNIFADGVLLASRGAVSSPDQNGDAVVNATDQALLAAKLGGPYDPTADLNCNAALEAVDTGILNAHLGHSCEVVVPVQPRSWGTIKILYR